MLDHQAITNAAAAVFLKIPGVHGVGFGSRKVRGQRTSEPAIIVYVDHKRAEKDIPPTERIPRAFQGLITDVVESQRPGQHADTSSYRPLKGGAQLAEAGSCNADKSYGTLGCICLDLENSNAACILTNNHVLEDTATGDRVYQPTATCNCCNCCPNVAAFKTRGLYSANVDGAIATIKSGVEYTDQLVGVTGSITGTYNLTAADATSGTYQITKSGRTSGVTTGILDSISVNTSVDGRSMTNQIRVDAQSGSVMSKPGDSGSVYLNSSNQVVGLNWGGPTNDDGSYGVGSPIAAVLAELNISIYVAAQTQSFRIGAPPVDPLEALAASVECELRATAAGGHLASAFHRHRQEIQALASADLRLLGTWRHYRGADFFNASVRAAQDRASTIPIRVGDRPAVEVLERLAAAVLRSGSQPLRSDLLRVLPYLKLAPGRTFPGLLEALDAHAPVVPRGMNLIR